MSDSSREGKNINTGNGPIRREPRSPIASLRRVVSDWSVQLSPNAYSSRDQPSRYE